MDWTFQPYASANHAPVAVVDGQGGNDVVEVDLGVGGTIRLNASQSRDPDKNTLRYRWFAYEEAGSGTVPTATVGIENSDAAIATVHGVSLCGPFGKVATLCTVPGVSHVILAVTDTGTPALTTYRRIIVHVMPPRQP